MEDDDLIPAIELTQWRAGRVLTQSDQDMLMRYLQEVDDEHNEQINLHQQAREQVLRELGGEDLVKAFKCVDEDRFSKALHSALKKFYEKRRAEVATAN